MLQYYHNLSKKNKTIFLIVTILLSIPAGAIIGLIVGLISTTFIPMCCNDNGCHNCFVLGEKVGYEATGFIGFWIGLFLVPITYISLIIYLELKK
ncbi:MAG: hypothetical protein A3J93_04610 [Candidatus Magasanikbacteria bacterium RIFOXYC2_FULL_42_28]|uniref:Uncharacterized protein n=1 Tax=Candidatus Magasanikbacteria bacterium RIFOXYC2_FULL_42_28 TaxID=1798704 RepID=A0A1F6NX64_9BACT|nr:MAG: hypothetical protein A3J93_04610 [Candidatus Magasanikbacteria bacterium RIFOXYC2_FULL_42_28]